MLGSPVSSAVSASGCHGLQHRRPISRQTSNKRVRGYGRLLPATLLGVPDPRHQRLDVGRLVLLSAVIFLCLGLSAPVSAQQPVTLRWAEIHEPAYPTTVGA